MARRLGRRALLAGAGATLMAPRLPAQGFAGMAEDPDGFRLPEPDPAFSFPRDHGAHPGYRIEWWYVTGNLQASDGTRYGVQWTLFRSALAPPTAPTAVAAGGWGSRQIWFAHAGVTTADRHFAAQSFARGGIGQAGVTTTPFAAWINDWAMTGRAGAGEDALQRVTLSAWGPDASYALDLDADGPLVFHGEGGYSVKAATGQASYYYSQPHFRAAGVLRLPDGEVPVSGRAWLDREWSSQPLAETQTGWDWFSLHFDEGTKMMVFRLRDSARDDYTSATWIAADGRSTHVPDGQMRLTPLGTTRVAGHAVPTRWRLVWPARSLELETRPLNPRSWMDVNVPYWEGPVTVTGTHPGEGFLEMTGYA